MQLVRERRNLDGLLPDWNHAPDWANWCAQNRNGNWYWFEKMPHVFNKEGKWFTRTGQSKIAGYALLRSSTWRDELYKRPKNGHKEHIIPGH
jgi:hypothetical protein